MCLRRSRKGEIQREFSITLQDEDHHYRIRLIPTVFDTMDEGMTIIGEDITKQIQFEESLMISETRYRAIVQDQTDVICRWRPDGDITFINESLSRFLGIPCNAVQREEYLFIYISGRYSRYQGKDHPAHPWPANSFL